MRWTIGMGITVASAMTAGIVGLMQPVQNPSPAPVTRAATAPVAVSRPVTLVVETGAMDHHPGWPEFRPNHLTVASGTLLRLTIVSYDTGAAQVAAAAPYARPFGLIGRERVNGKPVERVAPNQIAHTFTIPGLNVNVVIPVARPGHPVTVTAVFLVTGEGRYRWQCFAPCGSGPDGWGGAMDTSGDMTGRLMVVPASNS